MKYMSKYEENIKNQLIGFKNSGINLNPDEQLFFFILEEPKGGKSMIIRNTNINITDYFGYSKKHLIGQDIQILFPSFLNYCEFDTMNNILEKKIKLFGKHSRGYMMKMEVYIIITSH